MKIKLPIRIMSLLLASVTALTVLSSCGKTPDEPLADTSANTSLENEDTLTPDFSDGTIYLPEDDKTPADTPTKSGGYSSDKPTSAQTAKDNGTDPQRESVRITIPEGYTIVQIAKKLEQNGVCSMKEFIDAAQTYPFKTTYCTFLNQIPSRSARCYKLEGFLFPNTYDFYKNSAPEDAVATLIRGFQNVAMNSLGAGSGANGYSMYDVLTLASIVEKEVKTNTDKNMVAGILYNRLKKGMKLQMDSTRDYVNNNITDYRGKFANTSQSYDTYASGYNTYKCKALPAGPICNPGRSSIRAAMNPTKSDYLYFCTDANNKVYYAKTLEEHNANKKAAGLI